MTSTPLAVPRQTPPTVAPMVLVGTPATGTRRPGLTELPQAAETVFARDLEDRMRLDQRDRPATKPAGDDERPRIATENRHPEPADRGPAAERSEQPEPKAEGRETETSTTERPERATAERTERERVTDADEAAPTDGPVDVDGDTDADTTTGDTTAVGADPTLLSMLVVAPTTAATVEVEFEIGRGDAGDTSDAQVVAALGHDAAAMPATETFETTDPVAPSPADEAAAIAADMAAEGAADAVVESGAELAPAIPIEARSDVAPVEAETDHGATNRTTSTDPMLTPDQPTAGDLGAEASTAAPTNPTTNDAGPDGSPSDQDGSALASTPDGGDAGDGAETTPAATATPVVATTTTGTASPAATVTRAAAGGADAVVGVDASNNLTPSAGGRPGETTGTTPSRPIEAPMQPAAVNRLVLDEAARLRGGAGRSVIEVRLDPPELGEVSMEIRSDGRTITVVAVTESAEASAAMSRQREQIATALESLGMELAGFDVSTDAREQRDDGSANTSTSTGATVDPTGVELAATGPAPVRTDGSVFL